MPGAGDEVAGTSLDGRGAVSEMAGAECDAPDAVGPANRAIVLPARTVVAEPKGPVIERSKLPRVSFWNVAAVHLCNAAKLIQRQSGGNRHLFATSNVSASSSR